MVQKQIVNRWLSRLLEKTCMG